MRVEELKEVISDKYGMTADRKKQYHPEVLAAVIELAFNQIIFDLCLQAISHSDFSQLDSYIKPYYNVKVLCNEKTDEWYSELPAAIIQLPMNRGIRSISTMKDRKTSFMFRENGTAEIMENLELALINTVPSYMLQNWHVIYDERMTKEIAEAGVLMKLIPVFREWKDDDIIPAPSSKSMDIIAAVENIINQKDKEDQKPDSSPNDSATTQK